jgi:hypothetical protein
MSIYLYKKLDGTVRSIKVDSSKTEELSLPSLRYEQKDDVTYLVPSSEITHLRVWDIENCGWRTLIKSNILNQYPESRTRREESFLYVYKKMDGTSRCILASKDIVQFRAKIADKYPDKYPIGITHTRVYDMDNEGWRTLNNSRILSVA